MEVDGDRGRWALYIGKPSPPWSIPKNFGDQGGSVIYLIANGNRHGWWYFLEYSLPADVSMCIRSIWEAKVSLFE